MTRSVVAATLVMSALAANAQGPTAISHVAKLLKAANGVDQPYPLFEYDGVQIYGDMPLQDYTDAVSAVRAELQGAERVVDVRWQERGRVRTDVLQVMTCASACNSPRGASGRSFEFRRVDGKLRLRQTGNWIA